MLHQTALRICLEPEAALPVWHVPMSVYRAEVCWAFSAPRSVQVNSKHNNPDVIGHLFPSTVLEHAFWSPSY